MELINKIKELAQKIDNQKESVKTEESTKNSFIMPFLRMLGYDVFDVNEVEPEFIADVFKKGEKVDYAIKLDGELVIIIECKHWKENLDNHDSQLHRYFQAVDAKFGILTNGIEYRFYTDLDKSSKMDTVPFFEFDFSKHTENEAKELIKFHKQSFDIETITTNASILKYTNIIKETLSKQIDAPDKDFVKYFSKDLGIARMSENMLNELTPIVKNAFASTIKEMVNERLHSALQKEEEEIEVKEIEPASKIETTEVEIEGFMCVKSILRSIGDVEKIQFKDNQNYMAIYYEKQTQPIARLHFNKDQKYFGVISSSKEENRQPIDRIDDIFKFSDQLLNTLKYYLN